jgi:CheY-like chemotaxis protein
MTRNSGSVLVVDDDADVRHFVRASLEAEGYGVIEAQDGETALRLVSECDPAAIILDLNIGQPNGLEVCRSVRHTSNVPIVMHTSYSSEIDEAMCLAAGADDYLTKPTSGRIIALHLASQLKRTSVTPIQTEVDPHPLGESFFYPNLQGVEEEGAPIRVGRFLIIAAVILGTFIVSAILGLQLSNSHAPAAHSVVAASGTRPMSATGLIQNVPTKNGKVYWLNVKQGDTYSVNSVVPGVDQITYLPKGSNISKLNQFDVVIGTYRDISTYNAQPHPFLGANGRTVTLSNGSTLSYNQMSPDRAVVSFPNKSELVVLNYPTTQTLPTLIKDAQNLVPIA